LVDQKRLRRMRETLAAAGDPSAEVPLKQQPHESARLRL
jgi:hypothetical protein